MNYDTQNLIEKAAKAISELPETKAPSIRSTKVSIGMTDKGVETNYSGNKIAYCDGYSWKIPDVPGYIQNKTELSRSTIYAILSRSERLGDIPINPQSFLDLTSQEINRTLYDMMIDGIKYQKIGNAEYKMTLFEKEELEFYLDDFTFIVSDPSKTVYENFIPLDSNVESQFAKDCETSEQVRFYFKLPNGFKIPTPIGNYNPDWAVVFEDDKKIYFVAETKSTGTPQVDLSKLSKDEQLKIKCGHAHFKEFDEAGYFQLSLRDEKRGEKIISTRQSKTVSDTLTPNNLFVKSKRKKEKKYARTPSYTRRNH